MEKTSSGLLTKVKEPFEEWFERNKTKQESVFLSYETIKLQTYLKIIDTGNLKLLVQKGEPINKEINAAWEDIVRENGRHSNNYEYDAYLQTLKDYVRLYKDYVLVKASISSMLISYNDEDFRFLKTKGFKVDTTNYTEYYKSLQNCVIRAENYESKLRSKSKEMHVEQEEKKFTKLTIGDYIATLNKALGGMYANIDVLLCEYNALKGLIPKAKDKF